MTSIFTPKPQTNLDETLNQSEINPEQPQALP
jgi:hypothetical protein